MVVYCPRQCTSTVGQNEALTRVWHIFMPALSRMAAITGNTAGNVC